jgi:hypothetical protein
MISKEDLEILRSLIECGDQEEALKVIDWRGKIHKGLPPEHRSKNISSHLDMIYRGLYDE